MKIYIDCGTHLGEGITAHVKEWDIDRSWRIIGFEANPYTYEKLIEIKAAGGYSDRFEWLSFPNLELHQKAVWVKDGVTNFGCAEYKLNENSDEKVIQFIESHNRLVSDGTLIADHVFHPNPIDGASSLYPKAMHKFLNKHGDPVQKTIEYSREVETSCVDFSNFLELNTKENDEVYCKMDIERAEFRVLERCIKKGTIKRIKILDIEWHDYGNFFYRLRKLRIIFSLKRAGVELRSWK